MYLFSIHKKDFLILVILILVAFFLRMLLLFSRSYYDLYSDDAIYMNMARSIWEGNIWKAIHPIWMPFFPLVSAFFYSFIHDWNLAGRIVSVVFGSLLIVPVYFIGRLLKNRFVGIVASSFIVFFYPLLFSSLQSLAEPLQIFLFWMGFLFYLKAFHTNKKVYAFITGIFWGLTALTRSEGSLVFLSFLIFSFLLIVSQHKRIARHKNSIMLLFILLGLIFAYFSFGIFLLACFIVFLFFYLSECKKINFQTSLKIIIPIIIGFLIFYLPYPLALNLKYKESVFLAKATAFFTYRGYSELNASKTSTWAQDIDSLETFNPNSEFSQGFINVLKNQLDTIITNTSSRLTYYFSQLFNRFSLLEIILFSIGIYWIFAKKKLHFEVLSLTSMIIITSVMTILFAVSAEERYVYWVIPALLLVVSLGMEYVRELFRSKTAKFLFVILLVSFIYSLSYQNVAKFKLLPHTIRFSYNRSPQPIEFTKILYKKRVLANHEGILFESRSTIIYSPNVKTLDELLRYARMWKVDYIIAAPDEIIYTVDFLYADPKDYLGLSLVLTEDKRYHIYKVLY